MAVSHALDQLEEDLGLDADELAGALAVSARSLERWRSGETYPQREARRRLETLIELNARLREMFDSQDAIRMWMHGSNRYLRGLKPAEAAKVGRLDLITATLDALDAGIFI
jgi:transcriptional regulator with XRE-family HTH domain